MEGQPGRLLNPGELGDDPGMQTFLGLFTSKDPIWMAGIEGLGRRVRLEGSEELAGPAEVGTEGTAGQKQEGAMDSSLLA